MTKKQSIITIHKKYSPHLHVDFNSASIHFSTGNGDFPHVSKNQQLSLPLHFEAANYDVQLEKETADFVYNVLCHCCIP